MDEKTEEGRLLKVEFLDKMRANPDYGIAFFKEDKLMIELTTKHRRNQIRE